MNLFANMKIGRRLGLGFAVILGLSIVIAAIGVWRLDTVAESTRQMMRQPLTMERLISDWSRNINVAVARTSAVAKSSDTSLTAYFADEAATLTKSSADLRKQIEALVSTPQEKEMWDKLSETQKAYVASRDEVLKLKSAGNAAEANQVLEAKFIPTSRAYLALVGDFLDMQRKSLEATAAQVDDIASASRRLLTGLAVLVLAFGVVCAWLLTKGITGPLEHAVDLARKVADGDLSSDIEVKRVDETGQLLQALKDMNHGLANIVSDVRMGTDTIAVASNEIASGNLDLSQRTEEQASNLEQTAASMEELTATVNQNADAARQASLLAGDATQAAAAGGQIVDKVVTTMSDISESSHRIADIIGVIDGIAFQTNILALNAAVEAARAGEQGRGFAVVAGEVRSLAQRSAQAAKEIKTLINESVAKVEGGTRLAGEAGQSMSEIVTRVQRVNDLIDEISTASREQSSGIGQIGEAINQLDQVTQQNAALVEQSAAAAESLKHQTAQLANVVAVFRLAR
ncbi:MAG: MCP four helix bundle domain-containing protein [Paucibacter sp.]|nr:MCP four helix bundle domain-containing protein [Roseateles sp.]